MKIMILLSSHSPSVIKPSLTKWSRPYCRARVVEIIPGIYDAWDNRAIFSAQITHEADYTGMTLPYGTAILEIHDARLDTRNKNEVFKSIEARQAVPIFMGPTLQNGKVEWIPAGVFFQHDEGWETTRGGMLIKFDLVDIIGLLAERKYFPPQTLPTTLLGWLASIVSQLGVNFEGRYMVNAGIANFPLSCTQENVSEITCGQLLRYACMAAGAVARADVQTGYLLVEPIPATAGTQMTLDNLSKLPVQKANEDIASISLKVGTAEFVFAGTTTASSKTLTVENFFIKTQAEAQAAAQRVISHYGGVIFEAVGRGNLCAELGDSGFT